MMMTRIVRSLFAAAMVLSGTSAFAAEAEQQAVRAQCQAEMTVPAGTCDCLAGEAAELTEGQQQLLAATVTHDDAMAVSLRAQLSIQETMQVATFHVHQVPACAGGG
jgi:hypothetical protein